jgi:DtxR family Mn-dependent transcriptional regulator
VRPIVVPLTDLAPGDQGRVAYIKPRHHQRLDRLASFGVVPGTVVQLHQRKPSCVIKIGETDLALEGEVAEEIFVRPLQNDKNRGSA